MEKLSKNRVYAEMARRKIQFHNDEEWNTITLWGLFSWADVSHMLKDGELLTTYKKENRVIWVTPSPECWETKIKPLIDKYTLDELTIMAGW